jgi:hypothetical protein
MKGDLFASNDPKGTYQVWHRNGEEYRHVADVEAGNYMAAVILPLIKRGEPGSEGVTWLVDNPRSTTFGDKIVDPVGLPWEIYKHPVGAVSLRETAMPQAADKQYNPADGIRPGTKDKDKSRSR